MQRFAAVSTPNLVFGSDEITRLGALARGHGSRLLAICSRSVLREPEFRAGLAALCMDSGLEVDWFRYDCQPESLTAEAGGPRTIDAAYVPERGPFREASPDIVDAIAADYAERHDGVVPDAIAAIGGGSAIDTGKAVAVRFTVNHPITEYLEGVGSRAPAGDKLPFIAVPTTAGTGSEATKNAVLSRPGADGFKKSLRHDRFVPDVALVDPRLQLGCPAHVTAATGLDAITQLLEAYVSTQATPFTDALALDGLASAGRGFARAVERGDTDVEARASMAYAAYLSGICLANAGLGTVHGLAGAAGARTEVPHGVFCGVLVPEVTRRTVDALSRERDALGVLGKYAAAGRALTGRTTGSLEEQIDRLVERLREFVRIGELPGLRNYGFDDQTVREIAASGGNKANPYQFSSDDLEGLMLACR